jgi:transposase
MFKDRLDFEVEAMSRGRKLEPIVLVSEENNQLREWTRRQKTSQALALRAWIVLVCQQDRSNREIGREVRATAQTVGKWRRRFQRSRLDGLLDEPRPGAPRTISDEQVERVVAKTLHEKPRAATHWSSRTMAKATGLSQSAVVRIWTPLSCSRTVARPSSSPPIRCSSTRCAISWGWT